MPGIETVSRWENKVVPRLDESQPLPGPQEFDYSQPSLAYFRNQLQEIIDQANSNALDEGQQRQRINQLVLQIRARIDYINEELSAAAELSQQSFSERVRLGLASPQDSGWRDSSVSVNDSYKNVRDRSLIPEKRGLRAILSQIEESDHFPIKTLRNWENQISLQANKEFPLFSEKIKDLWQRIRDLLAQSRLESLEADSQIEAIKEIKSQVLSSIDYYQDHLKNLQAIQYRIWNTYEPDKNKLEEHKRQIQEQLDQGFADFHLLLKLRDLIDRNDLHAIALLENEEWDREKAARDASVVEARSRKETLSGLPNDFFRYLFNAGMSEDELLPDMETLHPGFEQLQDAEKKEIYKQHFHQLVERLLSFVIHSATFQNDTDFKSLHIGVLPAFSVGRVPGGREKDYTVDALTAQLSSELSGVMSVAAREVAASFVDTFNLYNMLAKTGSDYRSASGSLDAIVKMYYPLEDRGKEQSSQLNWYDSYFWNTLFDNWGKVNLWYFDQESGQWLESEQSVGEDFFRATQEIIRSGTRFYPEQPREQQWLVPLGGPYYPDQQLPGTSHYLGKRKDGPFSAAERHYRDKIVRREMFPPHKIFPYHQEQVDAPRRYRHLDRVIETVQQTPQEHTIAQYHTFLSASMLEVWWESAHEDCEIRYSKELNGSPLGLILSRPEYIAIFLDGPPPTPAALRDPVVIEDLTRRLKIALKPDSPLDPNDFPPGTDLEAIVEEKYRVLDAQLKRFYQLAMTVPRGRESKFIPADHGYRGYGEPGSPNKMVIENLSDWDRWVLERQITAQPLGVKITDKVSHLDTYGDKSIIDKTSKSTYFQPRAIGMIKKLILPFGRYYRDNRTGRTLNDVILEADWDLIEAEADSQQLSDRNPRRIAQILPVTATRDYGTHIKDGVALTEIAVQGEFSSGTTLLNLGEVDIRTSVVGKINEKLVNTIRSFHQVAWKYHLKRDAGPDVTSREKLSQSQLGDQFISIEVVDSNGVPIAAKPMITRHQQFYHISPDDLLQFVDAEYLGNNGSATAYWERPVEGGNGTQRIIIKLGVTRDKVKDPDSYAEQLSMRDIVRKFLYIVSGTDVLKNLKTKDILILGMIFSEEIRRKFEAGEYTRGPIQRKVIDLLNHLPIIPSDFFDIEVPDIIGQNLFTEELFYRVMLHIGYKRSFDDFKADLKAAGDDLLSYLKT